MCRPDLQIEQTISYGEKRLIRLTSEQFRYSSLLLIYSLLTLCIGGCATNPGSDNYIKDAGWQPKEIQILTDCYVPTVCKEG